MPGATFTARQGYRKRLSESTIVFGLISEVFNEEKQKALEGLLHKYSDGYFAEGLAYIQSAQEKTRVFKVTIETVTGKSRK